MGDAVVNTTWVRRYLIIVADADKAAANTKYANVDTNGAGGLTFNFIPLARTASPTTTVAWATDTLVTQAMIDRFASHIQDFIDAGKLIVYRLDDGSWTQASALADAVSGGLVYTQGA